MSDTMIFLLVLAAVALGAGGFLVHAFTWLALLTVWFGGGVLFLFWLHSFIHEASMATNCTIIVAMLAPIIYVVNRPKPDAGIEKVASVGQAFERPYEYRERA